MKCSNLVSFGLSSGTMKTWLGICSKSFLGWTFRIWRDAQPWVLQSVKVTWLSSSSCSVSKQTPKARTMPGRRSTKSTRRRWTNTRICKLDSIWNFAKNNSKSLGTFRTGGSSLKGWDTIYRTILHGRSKWSETVSGRTKFLWFLTPTIQLSKTISTVIKSSNELKK